MKKFFAALVIFLVVVTGMGYFVGDYFVGYALRRDNPADPNSVPPACAKIADPSLKELPLPDFTNENWTIKSADGLELQATYFLPEENSHKWAVLLHGYGRNQKFTYDYAEEYLKRGWNVLTPDLRAFGKSGGFYTTMGAFESRDVVLWIDKIVERDPQAKIIIHGVSMGAATTMMTSALEPKNLVAIVEDCGYTSAYEMFTAQLDKIFGLPEFPVMPCVEIVCKKETGVSISEDSPINAVKKTKVPTLFIHGDADGLVPYPMMQELFDASSAPIKEKFTVEGAGHADAKRKNPQIYFDKVFGFLEKFL